jgi:hypothetical protein
MAPTGPPRRGRAFSAHRGFSKSVLFLCVFERIPLCHFERAKELGFAQTQSLHRPQVGGGGRAAIAANLLSQGWGWNSVCVVTERGDGEHVVQSSELVNAPSVPSLRSNAMELWKAAVSAESLPCRGPTTCIVCPRPAREAHPFPLAPQLSIIPPRPGRRCAASGNAFPREHD